MDVVGLAQDRRVGEQVLGTRVALQVQLGDWDRYYWRNHRHRHCWMGYRRDDFLWMHLKEHRLGETECDYEWEGQIYTPELYVKLRTGIKLKLLRG